MATLRMAALVVGVSVCVCAGADAQVPVPGTADAQSPGPRAQSPALSRPDLLPDGTLYAKLIRVQPFVIGAQSAPATRPLALPLLYVSFAGLQAFDGYSTSYGINHGAVESNVLLRAAVDHPAALWAVKGGAALTSIWAAERLWRTNRRGEAIAVMVAANTVMAVVALNNYAATHPR